MTRYKSLMTSFRSAENMYEAWANKVSEEEGKPKPPHFLP